MTPEQKNWCQCEHAAHFNETSRTPNGNPGHKYGATFHKLEAVKTTWGIFHVCKDCADDCLSSGVCPDSGGAA